MDYFNYQDGQLFAEEVSVASLANQFGTPCFIYSRTSIEEQYKAYEKAFNGHPSLICYAVKANSNLAVLNVLSKLDAGFDIVSGGELDRVLAAGGDPRKVIFSGLGKTKDEIISGLEANILCFNIESEAELHRINEVAKAQNQVAPISIRVNPDVDAETHPYISTGLKENKFGVPIASALSLYRQAADMTGVNIIGIDAHIGSQLTSVKPFLNSIDCLFVLIDQLKAEGINLSHVDIGGGLGIKYDQEEPPEPSDLISCVREKFANRNLKIVIEPGRSIAANAGIFVTRIEYLKSNNTKSFAIVDGAMNDLIRPALYSAWQDIIPVKRSTNAELKRYDIVGPICESADFLGKDRQLDVKSGDLLAVRSAGAYGFVMSSNYNSRPRAPELMVEGHSAHLVRERETVSDLYRNEYLLPREK
jgi:diaminopimelate decarboxylase